jgi:hypothetical protein
VAVQVAAAIAHLRQAVVVALVDFAQELALA